MKAQIKLTTRQQYKQAQHAMRYLRTYYGDQITPGGLGHTYFLRKLMPLNVHVVAAAAATLPAPSR